MVRALPRFLLATLLVGLTLLVTVPLTRAAIGEPASVRFAEAAGAFALVRNGAAAPICVDGQDWVGVRRVTADFQADVERVSGLKPSLSDEPPTSAAQIVIIGTLGHSRLVDGLVGEGRIDLAAIRGRWESWITQVIEHPFPGIGRALVIAGSDERGSIQGADDISEQMVVSPWYWWADVPARRQAALYVDSGRIIHGSPAVKYRGIFLNDEAPDLTNWVRAKFGTAAVSGSPPVPPGIANYGREFYYRFRADPAPSRQLSTFR